jgi:hypothetical protein
VSLSEEPSLQILLLEDVPELLQHHLLCSNQNKIARHETIVKIKKLKEKRLGKYIF